MNAPKLPRALGLAFALSTLLASGAAAAQTGWSLDRFEPAPAGERFLAAEHPQYGGGRRVALRAGLVVDYARNPLVLRNGTTVQPLVSDMVVLHPQIGVAFLDRFDAHLSVPVVVLQAGGDTGSLLGPSNTLGAFGSTALGDPRIGARVRLVGHAEDGAISLHAGAQLYLGGLGLAGRNTNATDDSLRARAYLTAAGTAGNVLWSLTAGYHGRPEVALSGNVVVGAELYATAAIAYATTSRRVMVGPEVVASSVLSRFGDASASNLEALVGAHVRLVDGLTASAGVGAGINQGPGTPALRALLRVSYAPWSPRYAPPPPPADRDGDGTPDLDDVCPGEPAGDRPDPARAGCPRVDRDGDGVYDSDDRCADVPQGDRPDPARAGCPDEDSDRDGVADRDDACPTQPAGDHPDPERAGCPDGDADHDGVLDHADACRTEAPGLAPDPARPGCPSPDRDHDMVADGADRCPDRPGAPNPDPTLNGCPSLVSVEQGMLHITRPVFFATGRDTILPRSEAVLQAVRGVLLAMPTIRRLSIEGHTDDIGNDAANLDLSQRRATSVMNWLASHGIDASRLEAHGYGETRPLVSVASPLLGRAALAAARGQNRRVDFRVTDPAGDAPAP